MTLKSLHFYYELLILKDRYGVITYMIPFCVHYYLKHIQTLIKVIKICICSTVCIFFLWPTVFIPLLMCDACSAASVNPPPPFSVPGCWLCLENAHSFLPPFLEATSTPWMAQRENYSTLYSCFLKKR